MKTVLRTFILCFLASFSAFAQEKSQDSLYLDQMQELMPVVLTGQFKPQQVDKSIFEVDVLTQSDIKKMAGNTLDDVLKQSLNLNVMPNSGEGRSGVEQFGFNSEYIKILIDGVPVIGDEGFGNAIDISQINLDDIEQIEIVEGAMGVQYGANAVTGVINIITKKNAKHRWTIVPYVQEETVGSEYNWTDKGRHIQSLKVGHNFNEAWYGEVSLMRTDFRGFFGDKKGRYYFNPEDQNDKTRGYDWLPKMQHTAKALINYHGRGFKAFYKFEYFDEETKKYSNSVYLNRNGSTQTLNPTAKDQVFRSDRQYHHLNFAGDWNEMNYNLSFSYQEQIRNQENFTRDLLYGNKTNVERFDYNSRKGFFSRGTLSRLLKSDWYDAEIGYEVNLDHGAASGLSDQNTSTATQNRKVNTISGFTSAEFKASERLSFRPGARFIYSDNFDNQWAFSLSGKYNFDRGYQLRAVLGSAPKLPNFEELYFYMVDSNHDVRGNENLKPEKGRSVFLHLKKNFSNTETGGSYQPKLSVWYLDVEDKIDLILASASPLSYQFENIDLYKTWGVAFRNKFFYNQFTAGVGVSFNGESKALKSAEAWDDEFLYSVQVTGQLSYNIPEWNTSFSAYYKYTGSQYQFVSAINDLGETEIFKDKQDPYSWLDASARKTFLKNQLELTLGMRNILDIKDIKSTSATSGHSTTSSLTMGYGRSYFLKLLYNINF